MKEKITRTYKDIQLYARFAARKLGVPGYQIHQICLSEQKLIYIPIPKNACSSTKEALYEIEFDRRFERSLPINEPYLNIHDYYKKQPKSFVGIGRLTSAVNFTRFAIIRDPVKRLISCYRNRVVDLEELKQDEASIQKLGLDVMPDINTFVLNLKQYRKASKSIEHHSRPQASFLGGTLSYLDEIFPIKDLDELQLFLKSYDLHLKFLKQKSGGTSFSVSDLSDDALKFAIQFYREDYRLLANYYSPDTYLNRRNEQKVGM